MGEVYLAEQISLKRKVALKLMRPDLAANITALARFKAEAEAVAKATHANIVQVYAIHEIGGLHFMALEFVEGRNLREFLEKKGPPEILLGLSIMRQVAAALQRASELGIIHRDIKPENILLTRKGEVKVADFGLSRILSESGAQPPNLTQSHVTMGTPLYMSPEQVEGKKTIDHRTDIYSFGVTCYHMFAGHPPFKGTAAFEVAVQHVQKRAATFDGYSARPSSGTTRHHSQNDGQEPDTRLSDGPRNRARHRQVARRGRGGLADHERAGNIGGIRSHAGFHRYRCHPGAAAVSAFPRAATILARRTSLRSHRRLAHCLGCQSPPPPVPVPPRRSGRSRAHSPGSSYVLGKRTITPHHYPGFEFQTPGRRESYH